MAERRVSLPISNKRVEDILMWRDVQKSGIIFGSLTAGYLVLEWSGYSMLSLLAYAMLGILGGFLVWTNAAALLKKPGPPIPSFVKDGVSDDDILKVAQKLTPAINDALGVVHRTITGADMVLAAKVYELKKDEIDGAAAKALEQAKTLYSKAEAMAKQIPKARATDKKTE